MLPKPPRSFPKPKPKRLLREKYMTVALGVLGAAGIIVGADTEVTIGYQKTEGLKVSTGISFGLHGKNPSAIAITGAGDGGYLDYLFEEFTQFFRDHPGLSITQLFSRFRGMLRSFHKDHIVPFLPTEPDLGVDLIIGVQRKNETALWTNSRSALKKVRDYHIVGCGDTEAKRVFRHATWARHDLGLLAAVACYAIQRAKESATYCGKNTILFYITNHSVHLVDPAVIDKAEALFHRYQRQEGQSFMYAVGNPYSDDAKQLEKMSTASREPREEFKRLLPEMLEDSQ
jgi:hypothetical protein